LQFGEGAGPSSSSSPGAAAGLIRQALNAGGDCCSRNASAARLARMGEAIEDLFFIDSLIAQALGRLGQLE